MSQKGLVREPKADGRQADAAALQLLKVADPVVGNELRERASIIKSMADRPVRFEVSKLRYCSLAERILPS
jgi:hypothetical protein